MCGGLGLLGLHYTDSFCNVLHINCSSESSSKPYFSVVLKEWILRWYNHTLQLGMSQCVLLLLGGGVLSVDVGSVYCVSADTRAMTVFTQVSPVITLTLCVRERCAVTWEMGEVTSVFCTIPQTHSLIPHWENFPTVRENHFLKTSPSRGRVSGRLLRGIRLKLSF